MPKVNTPSVPLNGLFGVNKPSGPTSMSILESLKKIFRTSPLFIDPNPPNPANKIGRKALKAGPVKMGQGGTLDPLADGVLVVATGRGTKQLARFLDCTKEYRTVGLLGCATDSADSQGAIVGTAPWKHITRQDVENILEKFRGEIYQIPPVYSALKMDGKPLYEYARSNTPLPRPIEPRKVIVHELVLESWDDAATSEDGEGHHFQWPTEVMSAEDKLIFDKSKKLVEDAEKTDAPPSSTDLMSSEPTLTSTDETVSTDPRTVPPTFTLRMTVSGGTYVRSLVNDIGAALGSLAHLVVLTRTRQGEFSLEGDKCIPWSVFEAAAAEEQQKYLEAKARGEVGKGSSTNAKKGKGNGGGNSSTNQEEEEEEAMANSLPVTQKEEKEEKKEPIELQAWEKYLLERFESV
ncbi:Pseudouridine synthase [Phaffia rhodozyma]|uniref:tRNA pseudouridine(55) synthase n=1 Tax=Phaffia rhodozyma TaxID=264483 RepID=A0A0F7SJ69_PHARH|nr:Pseudouridine synthase [Phaffia rhodozyma]